MPLIEVKQPKNQKQPDYQCRRVVPAGTQGSKKGGDDKYRVDVGAAWVYEPYRKEGKVVPRRISLTWAPDVRAMLFQDARDPAVFLSEDGRMQAEVQAGKNDVQYLYIWEQAGGGKARSGAFHVNVFKHRQASSRDVGDEAVFAALVEDAVSGEGKGLMLKMAAEAVERDRDVVEASLARLQAAGRVEKRGQRFQAVHPSETGAGGEAPDADAEAVLGCLMDQGLVYEPTLDLLKTT